MAYCYEQMARHYGHGGFGRWLAYTTQYRTHSNLSCLETLDMLSAYCSEFLIHAADVEGLCQGIDQELVTSTLIMHEPQWIQHSHSTSRTWRVGDYPDHIRRRGQRYVSTGWLSIPILKPVEDISDLDLVDTLSGGRVDLTYGRWINLLL